MKKCLSVLLALCSVAMIAAAKDDLEKEFLNPPDSVKPHTWWHWMDGNITKEGITADLEAMKRVGINGAQIFNVGQSIPDGPAPFMSPQWIDLFKHAASEAKRLNMELCFHNCAGWSSSGGPWVKPEHGMQTVVTSEVQVKGPVKFDAELAKPRTNKGYYRDIAVLAYPTPVQTTGITDLKLKILDGHSRYGVQPSQPEVPAEALVSRAKIVDLTSRLGSDGRLAWDVPAGDWSILRVGHTPTGAQNAPSPVAGRGLEVDKLSREAFDAFWAGGITPILNKLGPLAGKTLNNCLIDSYEVGCNNWTPKFREEFMKRCGYDPILFLPVLNGRYVDGGEITERFTWDFRRTIGDLFFENYFGYFSQLCRKNGMMASIEPYDGPFECLQVGAKADILMGEFWASKNPSESGSVRLAASVAHSHGIRIVGAESFTATPDKGKWLNHPGSHKALGDVQWSAGINRFILHCYAHQPWMDKVPGMTMGQWGTHFGRFNTWWEQSRGWFAYIARGQSLLQKGQPVADVLFFGGEAAPNGHVHRQDLKAKGYDYDAAGTDLMPALKVSDGRIVTPCGTSYSLLVLPDTVWMTPGLARIVRDLVKKGATVMGPKPQKSPSLSGYPACDAEVRAISDEVWGKGDGENAYGKGRMITGGNILAALDKLALAPDCAVADSREAPLLFIHRRIDSADVYFVANKEAKPRMVVCTFRVTGRQPELWDAEKGTISDAPIWSCEKGLTSVKLDLEQAGSMFVVFRRSVKATASAVQSITASTPSVQAVPGGFNLVSARYGTAPEGAESIDITDRVKQAVKGGKVQVDNELAGADPAVNKFKKLWVEYIIDGVTRKLVIEENSELCLPETSAGCISLLPSLTVTPSGTTLRASDSGDYVVKFSDGGEKKITVTDLAKPATVNGPWEVSFQAGRGAPAKANFEKLISWPEHADTGIKYFSGTATYRQSLEIPDSMLGKGRELYLDLGNVQVIAEVKLNGKNLGILWKVPCRVDISSAARAGKNEVEIEITNLWPNRLIGDEQLPEDVEWAGMHLKCWPEWMLKGEPRPTKDRVTFTTWHHWRKDSPLQPSGLLGPVMLRPVAVVTVEKLE